MLAFAAAVALRDAGSKRRDTFLALLVGLAGRLGGRDRVPRRARGCCAGAARMRRGLAIERRSRVWRMAICVGLGAAATALVLFAYNVAAFGAPLRLGYQYVEGFAGMDEGFLGITTPRPSFLQEILFGESRGLVPLAPVLAVSPIGFVLLWRRPEARLPTLAAAAVVGYYVLFNASYFYWNGGNSYGPRHLGAALPFMCLGLAPLWSIPRWWLRAGLLLLTAYGFCLSAMAVSTLVLLPGDVGAPVRERILPAFASGELALNPQTFLETGQSTRPDNPLLSAWNVGQRLGLDGHASLIPLALAWCVAAALFWRASINPARQRSPGRPDFPKLLQSHSSLGAASSINCTTL